jgi:TolA protein
VLPAKNDGTKPFPEIIAAARGRASEEDGACILCIQMNSPGRALPDFKGLEPYGRRLTVALVLSLSFHAFLLSLAFGGQGSWLPGIGFAWHERRYDGADLQVALDAPRPPPDSSVSPSQLPGEPSVPNTSAVPRSPSASGSFVAEITREAPATEPDREAKGAKAAIAPKPAAKPRATARPKTEERQLDRSTSTSPPEAESAPASSLEQEAPRIDQAEQTTSPPVEPPAVIAATRTDDPMPVAPITPSLPASVPAEKARAFNPESPRPSLPSDAATGQARIDQETKEQAAAQAALELQRQQQLEAERDKAARQAAARAEAARLTAERQEAARAETLRIEAAKADVAANEIAKADAARAEAARVEAARDEAARVEAARVATAQAEAAKAQAQAVREAAARAEAARAEAARAEAARAEAARAEAARAEVERAREERLRAIGRQLDEERDRREAAAKLPPAYSGLRRYRLFGRADSNQDIVLYAEALGRKIQLNMTIDMVREIANQPHTDPLVTVAVRSDGWVETITFVRSSGVPGIDEAIRRVIESQTPYQPFPPNLAREYDVIEIRRTWRFDTAIRLE